MTKREVALEDLRRIGADVDHYVLLLGVERLSLTLRLIAERLLSDQEQE